MRQRRRREHGELLPVPERFTENEVAEAIYRNYGVKTFIAKDLDCTVKQLEVAVHVWPALQKCIADAREQIVDLAERTMLDALKSKDERIRFEAAKATLKTLGKTRGWGESDKGVVNIRIEGEDERKSRVMQIFSISDEAKAELSADNPAQAEAISLAIDAIKQKNADAVTGEWTPEENEGPRLTINLALKGDAEPKAKKKEEVVDAEFTERPVE